MEENSESTEFLKKMAMIATAIQESVKGKGSVIFEVDFQTFQELIRHVGAEYEFGKDEFKIDISGTDFIFILDK